MPDTMISKHLSISGRVQGVGFRASLAREAARRGLAGWVRNRRDGTVEALVSGESADVEDLVRWARRGPPAARVSGIEVQAYSGALEGDSGRFEQRPTE